MERNVYDRGNSEGGDRGKDKASKFRANALRSAPVDFCCEFVAAQGRGG
jgi:hypothetical protein